jgi:hypothetical protein
MRELDLKSIIVAGLIGSVLLYLFNPTPTPGGAPTMTSMQALGYGFALGASVQVGVRIIGVS